MKKKKRVSIIYNVLRKILKKEFVCLFNVLSRYIDYCNSLVAAVVTVTRPQS